MLLLWLLLPGGDTASSPHLHSSPLSTGKTQQKYAALRFFADVQNISLKIIYTFCCPARVAFCFDETCFTDKKNLLFTFYPHADPCLQNTVNSIGGEIFSRNTSTDKLPTLLYEPSQLCTACPVSAITAYCMLHVYIPRRSSLMSLAAWIPSSFRFFSICLLRAREAALHQSKLGRNKTSGKIRRYPILNFFYFPNGFFLCILYIRLIIYRAPRRSLRSP